MNYYEILGVQKTDSVEEIKAAFRRLAQLHHPDKNQGGNVEVFKDIQAAWDVLGDAEKRRQYDCNEVIGDEAARIEGAARTDVMNLFAHTLEKLDPHSVAQHNLKAEMLAAVHTAEKNAIAERKKLLRKAITLRSARRRIREGDFMFKDFLKNTQAEYTKKLRHFRFVKKVIKRVYELLETLDYDFEKTHTFTTYVTTNF